MPAVTAIDLGALTATIRGDATTRVATMIATALTNLEEDGRGLNEIQTAKLMENAVYFFDGFERFCAKELVDAFRRTGVEIWGLPSELADLSPVPD